MNPENIDKITLIMELAMLKTLVSKVIPLIKTSTDLKLQSDFANLMLDFFKSKGANEVPPA